MSFYGLGKLKPKKLDPSKVFQEKLDRANTDEERDRILQEWADQINKTFTP